MILFFLAFVLFIFTNGVTGALTVKNCGKSILPPNNPDRIVGGNNAKPGEFPFIVSLRELNDFGFEHACGASILNENWIITAAHCIDYPSSPQRYEILAGIHKLSDEKAPRVRRYKISKIIIHENYDEDTYFNDIALMKTMKPIDISGSGGYINGICLPDSKKDPSGFATVIGWGHTEYDGENSNILKKVMVPIIDRKLCNEAYDEDLNDGFDEVTENMICAGITGKDSCQNDSGGPLFQIDKSGRSILIGIVSHGAGCGLKFYPGIYTKIAMYQNWMKNAIS